MSDAARDALAADIEAMFDYLGDEARPESYATYLLQPHLAIAKMLRMMKVEAHEGGWDACLAFQEHNAQVGER